MVVKVGSRDPGVARGRRWGDAGRPLKEYFGSEGRGSGAGPFVVAGRVPNGTGTGRGAVKFRIRPARGLVGFGTGPDRTSSLIRSGEPAPRTAFERTRPGRGSSVEFRMGLGAGTCVERYGRVSNRTGGGGGGLVSEVVRRSSSEYNRHGPAPQVGFRTGPGRAATSGKRVRGA